MIYQAERVTVRKILAEAAEVTGFTITELIGPGQTRALSQVRFAVMAAARAKGLSLPQIGRCLGGRDHTTVLHGVRRASQLLDSPGFAALYAALGEREAA